MEVLIILPFAVPPVVSSVGLLQMFAGAPLPIVGTPWILIGTYFTITVPFMYRALANGLAGINLRDLIDAAHLLGVGTFSAFMRIIPAEPEPRAVGVAFHQLFISDGRIRFCQHARRNAL